MYSLLLSAAGDTLRILCIGNSFSIDAVEQELIPLAEAHNVPLRVGNLYIPGCSLEQHANNAIAEANAYSYRELYAYVRNVYDSVSLQSALVRDQWDIITFQQASHYSGIWETYEPFLQILIDTVKSYRPDARLAWYQTWAYAADATHPGFANYGNNQQLMYERIEQCTDSVIAHYSFDYLIPVGMAIQKARQGRLGDTLCRDGFHLNFQYGRYLAACVWLETLTGVRPHAKKHIFIPYYAYLKEFPDGINNRQVRSAKTERTCRRAADCRNLVRR